MFIDDLTGRIKSDVTFAELTITTSKVSRRIYAKEAETLLRTITANAEAMGMRVNQNKTQLLCTTTAINAEVRSFIRTTEGQILESGDTLKTVGFTFGRRPGAAEHVKQLRRKIGARAGVIRHLRKIGIPSETLTQVYCSFMSPVLEYASSSFHTILTAEQSGELERLQRTTLKTIHGHKTPYRVCLERSGIDRLDERRDKAFSRFAVKSFESERFRTGWFTQKKPSVYNLRKENTITEEFALRDRLVNAPLYKMRKIINNNHSR